MSNEREGEDIMASAGMQRDKAREYSELILSMYKPGIELDGTAKSFAKAASHLQRIWDESDDGSRTINVLASIYLCHLITEKPPRYLFKGQRSQLDSNGKGAQISSTAKKFLPMHADYDEQNASSGNQMDAKRTAVFAADFKALNVTACRRISYLARDIGFKFDIKGISLNEKYGHKPKAFNIGDPGPFIGQFLGMEGTDSNGRNMGEWASIKTVHLQEHANTGVHRREAESKINEILNAQSR
jgi:hypothetical protein